MSLEIIGLVTGELSVLMSELLINGGPVFKDTTHSHRPYGYSETIPLPDGTTVVGVKQPVPVWLIRGGDKQILVDTGMGDAKKTSEILKKHGINVYCYKKPEWEIVEALKSVGTQPDEIDIVVHTHLHYDHMGNDDLFPNAQFMVNGEELLWALTPPHHGALVYYPEFSPPLKKVLDRMVILSAVDEIIPGIKTYCIGGHSPGFTVVSVKSKKSGLVCLAGDLIFDYLNLELDWPPGFYYSLDRVMDGVKRVKRDADLIIPGHDWAFWEKFPDGVIK